MSWTMFEKFRHRSLEPDDGRDRGGGAIQRPVQPAERDRRGADGRRCVGDHAAQCQPVVKRGRRD